MSSEIQLLDRSKIRADVFFDRSYLETNWDALRADISSGVITVETCLAKLKGYEPLQEPDLREHAHWVDQQQLRLALLHKSKKPLELEETCEDCGLHKTDPHFGNSYKRCCLHCAELHRQFAYTGSRGSCEFIRPIYNPRSHSWALLLYRSNQDDNPFLFIVADFFKKRIDAIAALQPIGFYNEWLSQEHKALASERKFDDLIPLSHVMTLNLPLNPDQFREELRQAIQNDIGREKQLIEWTVTQAMNEHERKDRD